jgi:hypothetical protein
VVYLGSNAHQHNPPHLGGDGGDESLDRIDDPQHVHPNGNDEYHDVPDDEEYYNDYNKGPANGNNNPAYNDTNAAGDNEYVADGYDPKANEAAETQSNRGAYDDDVHAEDRGVHEAADQGANDAGQGPHPSGHNLQNRTKNASNDCSVQWWTPRSTTNHISHQHSSYTRIFSGTS